MRQDFIIFLIRKEREKGEREKNRLFPIWGAPSWGFPSGNTPPQMVCVNASNKHLHFYFKNMLVHKFIPHLCWKRSLCPKPHVSIALGK